MEEGFFRHHVSNQCSNQCSMTTSPPFYDPLRYQLPTTLEAKAGLPAALADVVQPQKNDIFGADRIRPNAPLWTLALSYS